MNNFKLNKLTLQLVDTKSHYEVAKLLVQVTTLLDSFDRYEDSNSDYRESPFGSEVREWLDTNLTEINPEADFADFS